MPVSQNTTTDTERRGSITANARRPASSGFASRVSSASTRSRRCAGWAGGKQQYVGPRKLTPCA